MGCTVSVESIKDFKTYDEFHATLMKYLPSDGVECAIFIDKTASNARAVGGRSTGKMIDGLRSVTGYDRIDNLHKTQIDPSAQIAEASQFRNTPHLLMKSSKFDDYMKALLMLYDCTFAETKANQVEMFTFGGSDEDGVATSLWAKGDIFDVIRNYHRAVGDFREYGRSTNFKPIADMAIQITCASRMPLICFILTDGVVSAECVEETKQAFIRASRYPISFVIIGIGGGDFKLMDKLDNDTSRKVFDNVQFMNFNEIYRIPPEWNEDPARYFRMHALMEVPLQFRKMRTKRLTCDLNN